MRSSLYRGVVGAVVALSLFGGIGAAQASSLTTTQISAIIGLLQSFGADQTTINSVSAALGGGQTTGTLICSSFSDVSYGQFDNAPGGRVSQLQTWLGISPDTFGFGTYGKKTQALWKSTCGGMVTPPAVTGNTTSNSLSAAIGQGSLNVQNGNSKLVATPVGVNVWQFVLSGNFPLLQDAYSIDFGDGTRAVLNTCPGSSNENPVCAQFSSIIHTYVDSSLHTVTIYDVTTGLASDSTSIVTALQVGNSVIPTATIDQSSLTTGFSNPTITGSASNISTIEIDLKAIPSITVPVVNGHWSAQIPYYSSGSYLIQVSNPNGSVLTNGTLTITPRQ